MESTQAEQQQENRNRLRDLWDSIKSSNIHIIELAGGERHRKFIWKKVENLLKRGSENR